MQHIAENYGAIRANKTDAETVCGIIAKNSDPQAVTLQYGYMIARNGSRIIFPCTTPRVISERRNANGRCTLQRVEYADGSLIRFTWNDARGYCYTPEPRA